MQQRLAATDGDDGRAERGQPLDAANHLGQGDGWRELIVFVAVAAGEVAAPHRDKMDVDGMPLRKQSPGNHSPFAKLPGNRADLAFGLKPVHASPTKWNQPRRKLNLDLWEFSQAACNRPLTGNAQRRLTPPNF